MGSFGKSGNDPLAAAALCDPASGRSHIAASHGWFFRPGCQRDRCYLYHWLYGDYQNRKHDSECHVQTAVGLRAGRTWIFSCKRITGLEADLIPLRLKVGMVFQQFNLFPHLTAGENVMLAPRGVEKASRENVKELAKEMLDRVGLADKFNFYPDQLSGGQ